MNWLEICVETSSSGIDALAARLTALGYDSFILDDEAQFRTFLEENRQYWDYVDEALAERMKNLSQIRFYLEDTPASREEIVALKAELTRFRNEFPGENLGTLAVSYSTMRNEDWENNWKHYYRPIPIGKRLLIVPEWMTPDNPEHRTEVRLDPGMIFGTGQHASTRMCLEFLEETIHGGETVVDFGSGSGILSIAAILLGAKQAAGTDIDPNAEKIARSNASLSGVSPDRFLAVTGNVLDSKPVLADWKGRCDIVLANIVADVIIPLAPVVPEYLVPGGTFICSGILNTREPEVNAALTKAGLQITGRKTGDNWVALRVNMIG